MGLNTCLRRLVVIGRDHHERMCSCLSVAFGKFHRVRRFIIAGTRNNGGLIADSTNNEFDDFILLFISRCGRFASGPINHDAIVTRIHKVMGHLFHRCKINLTR